MCRHAPKIIYRWQKAHEKMFNIMGHLKNANFLNEITAHLSEWLRKWQYQMLAKTQRNPIGDIERNVKLQSHHRKLFGNLLKN